MNDYCYGTGDYLGTFEMIHKRLTDNLEDYFNDKFVGLGIKRMLEVESLRVKMQIKTLVIRGHILV